MHGAKIEPSIAAGRPIGLVILAFPAKSPNRRKTLGPLPDLAEHLALNFLQLLCDQIRHFHPPGARIVNTASMDLDAIIAEMAAAHAASQDVARLHSGDLSVWSAMGEQLRRLRALDIPYDVTPGVPSFAAAAAKIAS